MAQDPTTDTDLLRSQMSRTESVSQRSPLSRLATLALLDEIDRLRYEVELTGAQFLRQHAAIVRLTDERDQLHIAIHGGCDCPAPFDTCPHDEPLLPALNACREALREERTRRG